MSNFFLSSGIGCLLLTVALLVLLLNERRSQRRRMQEARKRLLGLPAGEIVYEYEDGERGWLSSSSYPLTGKPTYVVQLPDGRPVPVEVMTSSEHVTAPHPHHIVHIAADCLILEDYFEVPPTHGILRYADREFTIEYSAALRKKVIRYLAEMARCSEQEPPALARQRVSKCRSCTFQAMCPIGNKGNKRLS